jgi:hypothetical protein
MMYSLRSAKKESPERSLSGLSFEWDSQNRFYLTPAFQEYDKIKKRGRMMLINVCSTTERIVRVIIGLAILSLVYFLRDYGAVRYWGLIGLIPIATAVIRYCPINHALGVKACTPKRA